MSIAVLIQYMDCRYNMIYYNMLYYWLPLYSRNFKQCFRQILNLLFFGIINMLHDIASPFSTNIFIKWIRLLPF